MKKDSSMREKLNKGQGELRFPTNRSLTLYFMQGSIRFFAGSAVFACLVAFFDLIIPRLIQYTVDAVIGGDLSAVPGWAAGFIDRLGGAGYLRAHLWMAAAAVAAAAVGGALSRYAFRVSNEKGAEILMKRTRDRLFRHLLSLPYAWIGENSAGDIIQRCTSDIETIRVFVSEQLTQLLHVSILIVMSLYFMISIQPKLTAAAAVFIPIMLISSLIFYGLIGEEFETVDSEEARLSAIAQENLTGVRVVRTFGREMFERSRFEAQNEFYTGHWIRLMRVLAGFWVSGNVIATTRNMTVAVFGAVLCVRGELTAGGMIAFLSYNALMSLPIRRLGRVIADLSKMDVSMERLRYIMNAAPEEEADARGAFPPMNRDIVFSHIHFRYAENAPEILRDVNMTIRAGTTVGILGATGAGKSTLVQLLDRLWELPPEWGTITVGGVDIREIDRGWLRTQVGMVLQEPYLFSRTLAENIAIAMPESRITGEAVSENAMPESRITGEAVSENAMPENGMSGNAVSENGISGDAVSENAMPENGWERMDDAIRRAAQIANLDEAIERFADGYETFVGERGVTLSGGQKQRAAIAQMLVRRTPIMIFDDSLSSVDAETDAGIRQALRENTGDATVILIAHRISTLRHADEIFVLDRGTVAEHGTHEELLAGGGIYSRVYALQTRGEIENE